MCGLKSCLWIAGTLCLLSLFGIFLPISALESITKFFGVESFQFPDTPMVKYVLRVVLAMDTLTGVYLIILALNPLKYPALIPFTGLAAIFIGLVCGITGYATAIPRFWFMGDAVGCLLVGILILVFWQKVKVRQTIEG